MWCLERKFEYKTKKKNENNNNKLQEFNIFRNVNDYWSFSFQKNKQEAPSKYLGPEQVRQVIIYS